MPIAWIPWIGQQPVLTRVDQQAAGQKQRARASRGNQDTLRINAQPVARGIETRDRLAQCREATRGGVTGFPIGERRLPRLDDRRRRGEVRLADFQMNDVMACSLQFVGSRQQSHHMKGFDGATTRTVGLSH